MHYNYELYNTEEIHRWLKLIIFCTVDFIIISVLVTFYHLYDISILTVNAMIVLLLIPFSFFKIYNSLMAAFSITDWQNLVGQICCFSNNSDSLIQLYHVFITNGWQYDDWSEAIVSLQLDNVDISLQLVLEQHWVPGLHEDYTDPETQIFHKLSASNSVK